jgi:hypothetical protein
MYSMVLPQLHWNFLGANLVQDCCRRYYVFTLHGVSPDNLKILDELEASEWLATVHTSADIIQWQSRPDVQQAVLPGMRRFPGPALALQRVQGAQQLGV